MNDWLWIIPVLYFLLTAIGGAASRKAKNAADKGRERRQRTVIAPMDEAAGASPTIPEPAAEPAPRPRQKTADDIAAEIRRMMGLPAEPVAQPVEVTEEYHGGDFDAYPAEAVEEETLLPGLARSHGGSLRESLAARDIEGRRSVGQLEHRYLTKRRSALADRYDSVGMSAARPLQSVSRGRGYVDLSNMARAFVTAEVLGPPKALRPDEW